MAVQLEDEGLSMWYDTADAPLGEGGLTVGVRPAHPSSSVVVQVRRRGVVTTVPARSLNRERPTGAGVLSPEQPPKPSSGGGDVQYFCAPLGPLRNGERIEVRPIYSCLGRQVPRRTFGATSEATGWVTYVHGREDDASGAQVRSAAPTSSRRFQFEMEFLAAISATLRRPPERIGVSPQGLRQTFYIASGQCVGPKLNATVRGEGADWMLIQRDGLAVPNVRTTWETSEGALIYADYTGVMDLGPDGYENAIREQYPALPSVQLTPRFVTSHQSYSWLTRLQCIGIGHVDMTSLVVEYDLYALKGQGGEVSRARGDRTTRGVV